MIARNGTFTEVALTLANTTFLAGVLCFACLHTRTHWFKTTSYILMLCCLGLAFLLLGWTVAYL